MSCSPFLSQVQNGDYSGGSPIQIGLEMGEIPMNTCRRYYKKGAKTVYLRMEAADRLLYKDVFIRERGYDERIEYEYDMISRQEHTEDDA